MSHIATAAMTSPYQFIEPRVDHGIENTGIIVASLYESLSTGIEAKDVIKKMQYGNLFNALTLADGPMTHADLKTPAELQIRRAKFLRIAKLQDTPAAIAHERQHFVNQLDWLTGLEKWLDEAIMACNEGRADREEMLEYYRINEEAMQAGRETENIKAMMERSFELGLKLEDTALVVAMMESQQVVEEIATLVGSRPGVREMVQACIQQNIDAALAEQ